MYQNWGGSTEECLNDGNEPAYMANTQYISSTLDLCCASWYSWIYDQCLGNTGGTTDGGTPDGDTTDGDTTDGGTTSSPFGSYYPVSA